MLARFAFAALALVAFALNPGCLCNGNGHVAQKPYRVRSGDDVVNCACNLTFANDHCSNGTCLAHFSIALCLPTELLASDDGGIEQVDLGDVDGGATNTYAHRLDTYCRESVTNDVYHLIKVFNGGWCDYKAPFAPEGGIGDSVECFAQPFDNDPAAATALDDGACRTPCDVVDCDFHLNCGGDVQDEDGTIHLDRCKCSQVTRYGCPDDPPQSLPTDVFCRPPAGDPLSTVNGPVGN